MEIEIYGGGIIKISEEQLNYWSKMYDTLDVEYEIEVMEREGVFKKKSKNGALKAINRNLDAKYNEELPFVCSNCGRSFEMPDVVNTSYESLYGVSSLFPNSHSVELSVCPYCGSDDIGKKYL